MLTNPTDFPQGTALGALTVFSQAGQGEEDFLPSPSLACTSWTALIYTLFVLMSLYDKGFIPESPNLLNTQRPGMRFLPLSNVICSVRLN